MAPLSLSPSFGSSKIETCNVVPIPNTEKPFGKIGIKNRLGLPDLKSNVTHRRCCFVGARDLRSGINPKSREEKGKKT